MKLTPKRLAVLRWMAAQAQPFHLAATIGRLARPERPQDYAGAAKTLMPMRDAGMVERLGPPGASPWTITPAGLAALAEQEAEG